MTPKLRVYVAGPITKGDQFCNLRLAIQAGEELKLAGLIPYVPHLNCFWHMMFPDTHGNWVDYDLHWLALCHAVLRLPGKSRGADLETARAVWLGIPVFHTIGELVEWRERRLEELAKEKRSECAKRSG